MSVSDTVTTLGATTEFKLLPNISSLVARELDLKLGGLVVARMTAVRPWAVVFIITTATVTYSIQHGLHTLTAVPRSTQPFTQIPPWEGPILGWDSGGLKEAHFNHIRHPAPAGKYD